MNRAESSRLIDWLVAECKRIPYGEISLTLIRHDGQTRTVKKQISISERCTDAELPK